MSAPLISVLMPVFNCQAHLAEAIDCIRAQTLADWELIVVDDGSTDDTPLVIDQVARTDQRIRAVRQANAGVGAALNTALDLARGKYLARMDGDDRTPADRFAMQVAFLEREPGITVVGGWHRIFGGTQERVCEFPTEPARIKATLLFRNPMSHPTAMMRRDAFLAEGWRYSERRKYPEDYDLWATIARRHELANLPTVLLDYRAWPGSVSNEAHLCWRDEVVDIQLRMLSWLGISAGTAERRLHGALAFDQIPAEREFLEHAHDWLVRIAEKNRRERVFDEIALMRVLTGRFIALARTAARMGVTVPGFASSPFMPFVEVPIA
jgi:hypothetical protein